MKRLLTVAAGALLALGLTTSPAPAATSAEEQMLQLINDLRREQGLRPYGTHPELEAKARAWAQVMADKGEIWHSTLRDGITASWSRLAENVGMGPTVEVLHQAFVDSPSHHHNLVHDQLELVGIGVVEADGTLFVAEEFMTLAPPSPARPAPSASAPPPQPVESPAVRPAPQPSTAPLPDLAPAPPAPVPAPVLAAIPAPVASPPLPEPLSASPLAQQEPAQPARRLAGQTISASVPASGQPVGLAAGLLLGVCTGVPALRRLARRSASAARRGRRSPAGEIGDLELFEIVSRAA